MTPEEAAAWAAEQPRYTATPATLNDDACCMLPGCLAPIYLDEMCADHWRLLLGYPGHARLRDEADDPTVKMLRAMWEAT